jgi:hypothetical protein
MNWKRTAGHLGRAGLFLTLESRRDLERINCPKINWRPLSGVKRDPSKRKAARSTIIDPGMVRLLVGTSAVDSKSL